MQLLRTPLRLSRLRYVFVTHLHGDHVLGLPGLLGTLNLSRHESPVTVFGPPGIARYLRDVARAIHFHPLVVLLLTTGAASAFGLLGLFIAVPVAGVLAAGVQAWRAAVRGAPPLSPPAES